MDEVRMKGKEQRVLRTKKRPKAAATQNQKTTPPKSLSMTKTTTTLFQGSQNQGASFNHENLS